MKVLGINVNLLHDSGAALVIDGELVAAVNEERLTGVKQQRGVPTKSTFEVLRIADVIPGEVDEIRLVGYPPFLKLWALFKTFFRLFTFLGFDLFKISFSSNSFQSLISRRLSSSNSDHLNMFTAAISDIFGTYKLLSRFKKAGFAGKIYYVPHYFCHLWAAYSSSGFLGKCLIVNIEGSSFEFTTNVYIGENGILKEISSSRDPHSAGHFYAAFCEILNFRPGFDEGKVTGLSSFGRAKKKSLKDDVLYKEVAKYFWSEGLALRISPKVITVPHYSTLNGKLPKEIAGFGPEVIAWAAQKRLEEVVRGLVEKALRKTGCKNVVLTGGVAANVRMNQVIKEIRGVDEIFIYPAMGDCGNAHGAAIANLHNKHSGRLPIRLKNLYLGNSYSDSQIKDILKKYHLKYKKLEGQKKFLAREIAKNKTVCLFRGRMEYGPRALGNRSILAAATDKRISSRLNHALGRDDFMPYAPVVLWEYRTKFLKNLKGAEYSAQFMTLTFNCTKLMKEKCPAVVHVDGTARPQLLQRSTNPFYYDLIKEYYKISGIPVLINTSLNFHDEPISCIPQDAIRTFLGSKLDYLVMENFLITK